MLLIRVTTGPGKSWKVLEFRKTIFQAWKVMENSKGHGKVVENKHNVMDCIEFLHLHLQIDNTSLETTDAEQIHASVRVELHKYSVLYVPLWNL